MPWTPPDSGVTLDADGTPRSALFDDICYLPGQGVAETHHVFLGPTGVDLAALLAEPGRRSLVVGELGFGTGLSFLLTWAAWRQGPALRPPLVYIAVEGYPMDGRMADRALAAALASSTASGAPRPADPPFGGDPSGGGIAPPADLAALAQALAAARPPRQTGSHWRLFEDGRVRLLLLCGPVEAMLASLDQPTIAPPATPANTADGAGVPIDPPDEAPEPVGLVDAWYLDGYAPARNPEMWSPAVLAQVARLSRPGARLATFTAAGAVRRGLAAVGFAVTRRPGFGPKAEALAGHYPGFAPATTSPPPPRDAAGDGGCNDHGTGPPPAPAGVAVDPPPPAPAGSAMPAPSPDPTPSPGTSRETPRPAWAARGSALPPGAPVAVIGAGVAGCAVAGALRRAGLAPVILEAGPDLAQGGSGNPVGLFMPRMTSQPSVEGRFHAAAAGFAYTLYQDLSPADAPLWAGRGLLALPPGDRDRRRHRAVLTAMSWPANWLANPDAAGQTALAGAPLHDPEAHAFPAFGCIYPRAVCAALARDVPCRFSWPVRRLDPLRPVGAPDETRPVGMPPGGPAGGPVIDADPTCGWPRWRVIGPPGSAPLEVAAVVICLGGEIDALLPAGTLPLEITRGQIGVFEGRDEPPPSGAGIPRAALIYGGYLTPPVAAPSGAGWVQVIGATNEPLFDPPPPDWDRPQADAHARILGLLRARLPTLADRLEGQPWHGRVARRCISPDHMPVAGPVPDRAAFVAAFGDLRHGGRALPTDPAVGDRAFPPGLWMLGGLGFRGFLTAPLAAEVVAAGLAGQPWPVETDVLAGLHPARYLARALKRGEI